jgi:hypothetical protein
LSTSQTSSAQRAGDAHTAPGPDDAKGIPVVDQRTKICVISLKIFISAVRETEMIADPKRKPHQDDGDSDKRRRQEEALDEALKNSGVRSGFSRAADQRAGAPVVPDRFHPKGAIPTQRRRESLSFFRRMKF